MRFKFLSLLFVLVFSLTKVKGQDSEIPKSINSINLSVGLGKDLFSGTVSWNKSIGLGSSNKFRLGYGVRFSTLSGSNIGYTTAPAKLASDIAKVDTLNIAKPNTMALNALIDIQYKLSKKLALGFNIDAIGLGLGGKKTTSFISSDNKTGSFSKTPEASPTSFNVLLVGNNDIGQLKSELYAEYNVSDKFGIRGGLDLTFSEYTSKVLLTQNNDRFRYKANMIFLGVSLKL
jgi:hypothetical protein